jgi:hypothetical protein
VSRRLWFVVAVVCAVWLASPAATAWAHPGHGASAHPGHAPIAPFETLSVEGDAASAIAPAAPTETRRQATPHPDPPHGGPTPLAFAAGALALVAAAVSCPRVLAVALAGLLALSGLEGVAHAALHLHHVAHGDGLPIGPATGDSPAADHDGATPGVRLDRMAESAPPPLGARATARPIRPDQGRAPPAFPA